MRPEHREVYDDIKKIMTSNHADDVECGGILNFWGLPPINTAFQAAVEHGVCQAWRKARGGGALLLERLVIGHRSSSSLVDVVGRACPDLHDLELEVDFNNLSPTLELPRGLRKLTVMLYGYENSGNANNAAIIEQLLAACPNLEEATIG